MPSCCGDGQFCDFPWCDCDGNADFRRRHGLVESTDTAKDCGEQHCNYCRHLIRMQATPGVATDQPTKGGK